MLFWFTANLDVHSLYRDNSLPMQDDDDDDNDDDDDDTDDCMSQDGEGDDGDKFVTQYSPERAPARQRLPSFQSCLKRRHSETEPVTSSEEEDSLDENDTDSSQDETDSDELASDEEMSQDVDDETSQDSDEEDRHSASQMIRENKTRKTVSSRKLLKERYLGYFAL